MGFGICLLGYLLVIVDSFGGGLIGWPLLVFGFLKLSYVKSDFKTASVLSAIAFFLSFVSIAPLFDFITTDGALYKSAYAAYVALGAAVHAAYLIPLRKLTSEAGAETLAVKAATTLYFTELYYLWALLALFIPPLGAGVLGASRYVTKYVAGGLNFLFLYNCFAKLTTKRQKQKEDLFLESEKEKLAKKLQNGKKGGDKNNHDKHG